MNDVTDPTPPNVIVALGLTRRAAARAVADVVTDTEAIAPLTRGLRTIERSWGAARWGTALLVASDLGALRLTTPVMPSLGAARRVVIHIANVPPWRRHQPWRQPPQTLTAAFSTDAKGAARWTFEFAEPVEIWSAVLAFRAAERRSGAGGLRVVAGDRAALEWCVDDAQTPTIGNPGRTWRGPWRPLADLVLRTADDDRQRGPTGVRQIVVADRCPPVDPVVANPGEFRTKAVGTAELVVETEQGGLQLSAPSPGSKRRTVTSGVDLALTAASVGALRRLRHLDLTAALAQGPWQKAPLAAATALTRLAAAGVPLVTGPLPAPVAALLHPDVVASFEPVQPADTKAPTQRETVGLRQRRAVHRHYTPRAAWSRVCADFDLPIPAAPTVSVLVATKRPELVERAVKQAARQRHVAAEVVLVTHGFELGRAELAQLQELTSCLTVRPAPEGATLGAALNLAVAAASGDVVSKMDDDDWYGAHHLEDLLQSLEWSGATLVGVVDEYSYLADRDVTVRHPRPAMRECVDTRVPGPSMTIRRDDLRALGSWRPVPIHEDLALNNAVWRAGGVVLRTHGLGYLRCRHNLGHTWATESQQFLDEAVEHWEGFHPPPELPADDDALAFARAVRAT